MPLETLICGADQQSHTYFSILPDYSRCYQFIKGGVKHVNVITLLKWLWWWLWRRNLYLEKHIVLYPAHTVPQTHYIGGYFRSLAEAQLLALLKCGKLRIKLLQIRTTLLYF